MGNPAPGDYANAMFDFAGVVMSRLVRENIPTSEKILDIGAGWGKYRFLLPEYEFDAIEVWEPYIEQNKLDAYYDTVYIMDAVNFQYPQRYGAVIVGDVLEHISVEGAQKVIKAACANADYLLVAVPFEMPQDEEDGNHHEIHIQDDLNMRLMAERYPELTLHRKRSGPKEHTKAIYWGNIENRGGGPRKAGAAGSTGD